MKTKEYIDKLWAQWNVLADKNAEIKRQENEVIGKIREAVAENVAEKFADFKEGEKVLVTETHSNWHRTATKRELFFHKPTVMSTVNGTYECDYEIRFHGVNKDGSESKRGDLYDNCIPISRIVSIEKI